MTAEQQAAWLRRQYDEVERIALEASRDGEHQTPTGEHWHWVETEHDQPVPPDPVTEEFVGENADSTNRVALRSVEEYPTMSGVGPLPHFVVPYAEEVPAVCGLHIALHSPARVLAEVAAKRRRLDRHRPDEHPVHGALCLWCSLPSAGARQSWPCPDILDDAAPYAEQPGYPERWRS